MKSNGVKIKDILGAVITNTPHNPKGEYSLGYCLGLQAGLDEQGEVQITLNREKLAKVILLESHPSIEAASMTDTWAAFRYADAIISNLPELLERVKE